MSDLLCFWLVPTHETRSSFAQDIARLAERFDAPVFEPHLTVHVGPADRVASPASVLGEAAFECGAITLQPSGVGHSPVYTKTLYIEFHQDQALLNLASYLEDRVPSDYVLKPHLSLLYHYLPEAERAELASSILIPTEGVRFEVLQAVLSPKAVQSADDVRSWRILEEWRLTEPAKVWG